MLNSLIGFRALLKNFLILHYFNRILLPRCNVKLQSQYCKCEIRVLESNFSELQYIICCKIILRFSTQKKTFWETLLNFEKS